MNDLFISGGVHCSLINGLKDNEFAGEPYTFKYYTLLYVSCGKVDCTISGDKLSLSSGSLVSINPGFPYRVYSSNGCPGKVYQCLFSIENLYNILPRESLLMLLPEIGCNYRTYSFLPDMMNSPAPIFEILETECRYPGPNHQLVVKTGLTLIFTLCSNPVYPNYKNEFITNDITSLQRKKWENILLHIRTNYLNDISLDSLSVSAGISKNYFSRTFKKLFGINYIDYVVHLKIEEACRLLTKTDFNINEIAGLSGFKDIKYFYSSFKKIKNTTPGQYRTDQNKHT